MLRKHPAKKVFMGILYDVYNLKDRGMVKKILELDQVHAHFVDGILDTWPTIVAKQTFTENDIRQPYRAHIEGEMVEGYVYEFGELKIFVERSIQNMLVWSRFINMEVEE